MSASSVPISLLMKRSVLNFMPLPQTILVYNLNGHHLVISPQTGDGHFSIIMLTGAAMYTHIILFYLANDAFLRRLIKQWNSNKAVKYNQKVHDITSILCYLDNQGQVEGPTNIIIASLNFTLFEIMKPIYARCPNYLEISRMKLLGC